tara:strand:- start:350 stop:475 length:126 start_codon:yes stop_codon:yes gene_type:complete
MGKFKYNIKETKKPKDVDPALIARLEKLMVLFKTQIFLMII